MSTRPEIPIDIIDFFDFTFDLMCIIDYQGQFLKLNPRWKEVLGHDCKDLIGRSFVDYLHIEDTNYSLNILHLLNKSVPITHFVNRFIHKDGSYRYLEWSIKPFGKNSIFAVIREGTERVNNKRTLEQFVKQIMTLLESEIGVVDYQLLCDEMQRLSGARAVMLNIYYPVEKKFRNVALCGDGEDFERAREILGFDIRGSAWDLIKEREDMLNQGRLVCFDDVSQYLSGILPDDFAVQLDNILNMGKVFVIQLSAHENYIGHFIMFMDKEDMIKNSSMLEIYANMAGMAIKRSSIEREISKSEEKNRLFIRNFLGIAYQVDIRSYDVLMFEGIIEEITGYERQDFAEGGVKWMDIVYHEDLPALQNQNEKLFKKQQLVCDTEYRIIKKDGNMSWVRDIKRLTEGTFTVQGAVYDINRTKQTEQAFIEKNTLLTSLLNSMPDIVFIKDLNGVYLACNPEFARYAGRKVNEIVGSVDADLFKKEVAELFRINDRIMLKQAKPRNNEEWVHYPDGTSRLMDTLKAPLIADNGMIIGLLGVSRDITETKKIQTELIKSEEKLRQITENMGEVFWLRSANNRKVLYINPAYEKIWQRSCESLYQDPDSFLNNVHHEDIDKVIHAWNSYNEGDKFDIEFRIITPDNTQKWIWARSNSIKNEFDITVRHLGIAVDITQKKKDRQQLEIRDKALSAIAVSAKELVGNRDIIKAIKKSFVLVGEAIGVDRVYLFKNDFDEKNNIWVTSQLVEWNRGEFAPQIDNPGLQSLPFDQIQDFLAPLQKGLPLNTLVRRMKEGRARELLMSQDVRSILALPIFKKNKFWGFIGFDECKYEREWKDVELALLGSFASIILSAIERKEIEDQSNIARVFLSNLSHEIRTPLNGIIGFLELLGSTDLSEEQQEYLSNISRSSEDLLAFMNNLLNMSRIQANSLTLKERSFNLNLLTEKVISDLMPAMKSKCLRLETLIDVPGLVYADPDKLELVLKSIINNAVKFTEKGTISIEIRTENGSEAYFTVKDTGIGIPPEKKEAIFEPFIQADPSLTRKYQGSGLGLAICNNIIKMMGGRIWVESDPGKGSKFYWTIPLTIDKPHQKINPPSNITGPINQNFGQKALIVEDNEISRKLLIKLLEKSNIKYDIAENGKEALDKHKTQKFNIIFMDCQMPVMDGYEATRIIRERERGLEHTLIIAMTALSSLEDEEKCKAVGMDFFIRKPVTTDDFSKVMQNYISGRLTS